MKDERDERFPIPSLDNTYDCTFSLCFHLSLPRQVVLELGDCRVGWSEFMIIF